MLVWFIKVVICCILCLGFIMAILGSLLWLSDFLEKKWVEKTFCFPYACLILMFLCVLGSFVSDVYNYLFVN